MTKLQTHVRFPADQTLLIRKLTDLFREHAEFINALSAGSSSSSSGANGATVACNFGATFSDKAQTVVTGQTWVTAASEITPQVLTPAGVDPDEMRLLDLRPVVSDLVAGVGFTLTLYSEPEATGSYSVMCVGV